jgi:SAM-dependent methyltransferase
MDERVDRITIIESSDRYSERGKRLTSPTTFVRAHPSGDIALPDEDADLVVCLGVLHHIPNVTHVLSEFARILSPGGYLILREPVISMGDWRQPRPGLTPRERGIPRKLLADAVRSAGFNIQREALIGFPLIANTWQWLGKPPYNNRAWTILDRSICTLTTPNLTYHATSSIRKLRPTSAAIVAQRR